MDYIIFKADGSIDSQISPNPSLKRYIQQGNDQVDKIFIGYPGGLETDYCQAVFTLPNHTTNTELGVYYSDFPYDADDPEEALLDPDYSGNTCPGWVITLTEDQTIYSGILCVAVRVIRTSSVLVNYPFALVINETGVRPDIDSGVTIEEIDSYLLNIQLLVTNAVQANTDSALSLSSENPVQNKVVTAALNDKRDIITDSSKVYVTGSSSGPNVVQTSLTYSDSADNAPFYIVQRNADSQILVPLTPIADGHAASKYYVDALISTAYKAQGSSNVAGLNGLTKSQALNGNVYNVTDAGNLTNEDSSTEAVLAGDNVIFIWNNGDWYWDKLAGFIDLSNYVTLNGVQTFTGTKTIQDVELLFSNTSASGSTKWAIEEDIYGQLTVSRYYNATKTVYWELNGSAITPKTNDTNVVGNASKQLKKVYLVDIAVSQNLTDGTVSYTIAESHGALFNKTISGTSQLKWSGYNLIDASGSIQITFTYETLKTGCYSEYKGIISNVGNTGAVTLIFTGVNDILCNDDNITISTNTVTLPADAEVEFSLINDKLILVNFEVA